MKLRTSSLSVRLAGARRPFEAAFTMVEIALCLAIIGFALVAIIGALPAGMGVQNDNRQETIINQDAAVWMDAIRNGAQGYDDLTNYVLVITNTVQRYKPAGNTFVPNGPPDVFVFTRTNSRVNGTLMFPAYPINTGLRIVGLLSTPKYQPTLGPWTGSDFRSNYVVAIVRSMSGAAVEKNPQANADILESAFSYRLIAENAPYLPAEVPSDPASAQVWTNLMLNSRDLRLTFRWPLLNNGVLGNGRQTFRMFVGGSTNVADGATFFQSSAYRAF
jgi:type II secretory pathway pseudopilin PulG